jgi:hypothetical protein
MNSMKRREKASTLLPPHDYGVALQSAVSWLGDRYLLAQPVPRSIEDRKPFFVEARSWLDSNRNRSK